MRQKVSVTTKHLLQANMSTIMISEIMERHIKSICSEYGTYIVNKLSEKYGFSAEEANRELELPSIKIAEPNRRKDVTEKKPKAVKVVDAPAPSIPLPFCGKVVDSWCTAIVKNNKLYTQCTNTPVANGMCKKCSKILEKEGELPFGSISSRVECEPMSYKDAKGNVPVLYSVIMTKLNITREVAETEAAKFGLTIPEEQFAVIEKSRGRPKKEATEKSSDDEAATGEKKPRGRPKKEKLAKTTSKAGDDIIAGLLKEAKDNDNEVEEEASVSNSSDAESEEKPVAAVPEKPKTVAKKPKQTEAEKAAAKEAAKAAKEAEKEAAKAAKEAEKAAAKAAKEAEKTAAKAATKAAPKTEKPKTKAAPVVVVEEPKVVAAATSSDDDEEQAEEYENSSDDEEVAATAATAPTKTKAGGVAESKGDDASEEEEEEEDETLKKFEHAGKKYKISTMSNLLYDWDNNEPVGVWNPKTKKIDELPSDDSSEEEESEEEEPVTVKKFEHEGKKYKISSKDNILYDWTTEEPVGVWNPKTKKIDELPDDSEEEEEDDE